MYQGSSDNAIINTMGIDEILAFRKNSVTHGGFRKPVFNL